MRTIFRFSSLLLCLVVISCTSSTPSLTQINSPTSPIPTIGVITPTTTKNLPTQVEAPTATISPTQVVIPKVTRIPIPTSIPLSPNAITVENASTLVQVGTLDYRDQIPGSVVDIAFSPDGNFLAAGYRLWNTEQPLIEIILWDLDNKTEYSHVEGHYNSVSNITFHPSGRQLAYVGYGDTTKILDTYIWDLNSGKPQLILETYHISSDKYVKALDLTKLNGLLSSIAYSPDGSMLVLAGGNFMGGPAWIALYDPITGNKITILDYTYYLFPDSLRFVYSMAFSPDGKLLATATTDGVWFWDLTKSQRTSQITDKHSLEQVAYSPDGKILAIVEERPISLDGRGYRFQGGVHFWDMQTAKMLYLIDLGDELVSSIAFSRDGTLFAIGQSQSVTLWDMATNQILTKFSCVGGPAFSFSPDGSLLAVGDESGVIHLLGLRGD